MENKNIEKEPRVDEEFREIFANRLKRLRSEKDLTLDELSKILTKRCNMEVSLSSLGSYERANRMPSLYVVADMADFFGVTIDYLLGASDLKNAKVIQTTVFDKNNQPTEIKLGVATDSDLANMSIKEVKELVEKLRKLGIDLTTI